MKSLGRSWVPSPARTPKSGRLGTWSLAEQLPAWKPEHTSTWPMSFRLRSKHLERLVVVVLLLLALVYTAVRHAHLEQRNGGIHTGFRQSWRSSSNRHIDLAPSVTWSSFAYATYATTTDSLCNSLTLLASLRRLQVNADLLLLYSDEGAINPDLFPSTSNETAESRLLRKAREYFDVNLQPVDIVKPTNVEDPTWQMGFTKLLAFNQTQYSRILMLDSDATVLRSMDELFLSPPSPVAMPRAYWLTDTRLADHLTLVEPSTSAFRAIEQRMRTRRAQEYDMEIINAVFGSSCAVLPHRAYSLLTGEFRGSDHNAYLGSEGVWDAEAVMLEAKYVHFSDWPLSKPWLASSPKMVRNTEPRCGGGAGNGSDECAERKIWRWLYADFRERRKDVCGADFASWEAAELAWKVDGLLGAPNPAQQVDKKSNGGKDDEGLSN